MNMHMYSVFHVILLQEPEQGCCELVLRLIMSLKTPRLGVNFLKVRNTLKLV